MLVGSDIKKKLIISVLFLIIYYLIFGITSYASGFIHHRMIFAFPFEYRIPFYPACSIMYLSINLYLLLALFIFPKWEQLGAFAIILLIETFVAGVLFISLPMQLIYKPITGGNEFSTVLYIAKFFSMNNNYFPSLHTAFAFTAALAYSKHCSRIYKIVFFIWSAAIALSTLFIHEHQMVDLIAGFILALITYQYVLPAISLWLMSFSVRHIHSSAIESAE